MSKVPLCVPESEWGCEARQKLGIARGLLEEIAALAKDGVAATAQPQLCDPTGDIGVGPPERGEQEIRDLAAELVKAPHLYAAIILAYGDAAAAVLDDFHSKGGIPNRSRSMRKLWVAYRDFCFAGTRKEGVVRLKEPLTPADEAAAIATIAELIRESEPAQFICPCGDPVCPTGPECFRGSDYL